MKKLISIVRSRRGVAIEMAIGVMLLTVAFSILLVSVSLMQAEKGTGAKTALEEKIAVMQILEDVESGKAADDETYEYSAVDNVITVTDSKGITLVITVEDGKIVSWQKQ